MNTRKYILPLAFITILTRSLPLFAQSDTLSYIKPDSVNSLGFLSQFAFSSVGFAVGFIPGGYAQIASDRSGGQSKTIVWAFTSPILSSLGTDLAKTNFWRKKNVNGSFWGGVLGGALGELGGSLIRLSLPQDASPVLYYMGWWIPTSLLSVVFYNLIGDGLATSAEPTNIIIQPFIGRSEGGVHFYMKF